MLIRQNLIIMLPIDISFEKFGSQFITDFIGTKTMSYLKISVQKCDDESLNFLPVIDASSMSISNIFEGRSTKISYLHFLE